MACLDHNWFTEAREQEPASGVQASRGWYTGAKWIRALGAHLLPECDTCVERDAENNPLGGKWAQAGGWGTERSQGALLVGSLGCTSVCIRKATARWSLVSGLGFEVVKDYAVWACLWNRAPPDVPIHRHHWHPLPPTVNLWCPSLITLNIVLTVKEKCLKSSIHYLQACTEGQIWSWEAIDWQLAQKARVSLLNKA